MAVTSGALKSKIENILWSSDCQINILANLLAAFRLFLQCVKWGDGIEGGGREKRRTGGCQLGGSK